MTEKKTTDEIKVFTTPILDIYDESVIIMIDGWRMHVYLDLNIVDANFYKVNKSSVCGRNIQVNYIGDLSDPCSVKLLPLKNL